MAYTILLVDDEELVTQGLRRTLRKENYEVFSATSANEALDILAREKVDVVVSDEMMPGMLGSNFLGIVFEKYPETIRIILTGHPNLDSALRSINKGHVYHFLIKPCNGMELCITIRQAIRQRELLRKSLSLLQTVERQSSLLEQLESQHPGITHVDTVDGAIEISDVEEDLDALFRKMDMEIKRSQDFLTRRSTT